MTKTSPPKQPSQPNTHTVSSNKLRWVDIDKPTVRDIEYLSKNYGFHHLALDDCLSRIQRPKIDEYDDYLFMVLHFPVFRQSARVTTPSQVSIFLGSDYLVTLHGGDLKPLVKFFKECQAEQQTREESMDRGSGYLLYLILDHLVSYCFPILYKVIDNIEKAEDRVFSGDIRETMEEVAILRRDLIAFRRTMKPQMEVIKSLEEKEWPLLKEELDVYFGDIADHIAKIEDSLEDYKEVIEGLKDTAESLTSHRINQVMRALTLASTIMLPLTVVASIYGMNIPLPLQESPFSFVSVMAIMLAISGAMLLFFRINRWI